MVRIVVHIFNAINPKINKNTLPQIQKKNVAVFTQIRIVHIYNAIFFGGSTIEVSENVGKLWNVSSPFFRKPNKYN
jgi:hypothetical protein